jgi:hypothetical protein
MLLFIVDCFDGVYINCKDKVRLIMTVLLTISNLILLKCCFLLLSVWPAIVKTLLPVVEKLYDVVAATADSVTCRGRERQR